MRRVSFVFLGLGILISIAGCEVERVDRASVAPQEEDTSAVVPNPREANPPGVEVEPGPPVPEDLPAHVLIIPVAGVEPDELSDTFTESRGRGRPHDAIDIMAPRGRPVVAAVSGEILRLIESDAGGLTIYQLGPDREHVYYYAHLDGYHENVAEGDIVRRGQVIGYVGDTGNAPPGVTHLHFAIWIPESEENFWEGEAINPYPLLISPANPSRPGPGPRRESS